MIKTVKNEGNLIYYECDCGALGRCLIKPLSEEGAIVVNLRCAMCESLDRLVLLQYKSTERKTKMLENLNSEKMSWSLILSNELVK